MTKFFQRTRAIIFIAAFALFIAAEAKINRSAAERNAFQREHPCPANGAARGKCPGWVIDHVKALACGGADKPSNMQWQTVQAAKEKDKWERVGCSR